MTDHCCLLMHNEFKYFMKVLFKIQVHSQIWPPPVANFTRPLGMGGVSKKELFRLTQIQIQLLKTVSPIMLWIAVAFLANMVASGSQFSCPLGMGGGSKKELFGMTKIQIQLPKTVSPIVLWIAVAFLEWTQFPWWWWWWFRRSVKKCDSRSIWYATSRQKLHRLVQLKSREACFLLALPGLA